MRKKPNKIVSSFAQSEKISTVHNSTTADRAFRSLALIIAFFTFILYLPTLKNGFVNWDDYQYILDNLHIRSLNGTFFRWAFTDTSIAMYWHPLTWISHAIDYALWEKKPVGHHLTSIVLHVLNTTIVVYLTKHLLEAVNNVTKQATTGTITLDRQALLIICGVTGVLFGIHPLHVESVAWVAMRKDLLYAFFYMLAIMRYLSYVQSCDETVTQMAFLKNSTYYETLMLFILALCCKPMAVSLPFVLLLLDWYPFKRISIRKSLVEKLPYLAASAVITVSTVITQKAGDTLGLIESYPLSTRLPAAFMALATYIGRTVMPVNLLPLYPYPDYLSLTSPSFLVATSFIIIVTSGCIFMARRQPFWLAAWLFYIFTVAPTLWINQVGANRYIYLSTLGLCILLGLASSAAWTKAHGSGAGIRLITAGTGIIILGFLSYLTLKQVAIWDSSITLWNYTIENGPPNPSAFNSRGHVLKNAGAFGNAIDDYSRAIALKPYWATYYVNRGVAYCEKGEFDKALYDVNKAVALQPSNYMVFNNRGAIFFRKGDTNKALDSFNTSIALNPGGHMAYNNRGMVFRFAGKTDMAKNNFDTAIAISPDYVDAYYNRSVLYNENGEHARALEDLNRVISLNPAHDQAYLDRGDLYLKSGNVNRGLADYQKACDRGNNVACGKTNLK